MSNIRSPEALKRDDEYLRYAWAAGIPTPEIAQHLQRPISYIASRASSIGVRRPEWFVSEMRMKQLSLDYIPQPRGEAPPTGHRMTEEAIAKLYDGRRYESIDAQDNNVGRIHLSQTYIARANVLAGAA